MRDDMPSGYVPTAKERRALDLFRSAPARAAEGRIAALFAADRNYARDRQAELASQAAAEHFYAALESVVQDTPEDPEIFRSLCHPRRFADISLPGSRYGIDNPDNIYRLASIDPAHKYILSGQRPRHPSADVGLTVMAGFSGDGRLADSVGYLSLLDIETDPQGNFEILLGAEPFDGPDAHFSIAGGRVLLFRDTQGDWAEEQRYALDLRCVSAKPQPDGRSDGAILTEAERLAKAMVETFLGTLQHRYVEHHPANVIKAPRSSGDHGGLVTQMGSLGWFELADDEALIVDIDPLGARYFGFQIADLWTVGYDYTAHLGSMNGVQAVPDEDGRLRFVVAPQDPGVHNWVDSGGHRVGSITLRWHHPDPAAGPHKNTAMSQRVKRADLAAHLPASTHFLTPAERKAQRAARANGWARRMEEDVAERKNRASGK